MQKIMFNDRYGLTQAALEGRKTMTRRVIKPQPDRARHWNPALVKGEPMYYRDERGLCQLIDEQGKVIYPVYKVGEIVVVAQSYEQIGANPQDYVSRPEIDGYQIISKHKGWRNKMYTRAELMPHQIRITGVRAERLQDITDGECLREGVRFIPDLGVYYFEDVHKEAGFYFDDPRTAFSLLIDKVSGKGTWERNPWVWVYEFELVK